MEEINNNNIKSHTKQNLYIDLINIMSLPRLMKIFWQSDEQYKKKVEELELYGQILIHSRFYYRNKETKF